MRKNLLWIFLSIPLILCVNMIGVSTVGSPTIAVVPSTILDPALTAGENFTVSIYTNYTGSDVWAYEFTLSYNPDVLHGGINYADAWTGNGTTTEWNTTYPPHYDSQKVYVNSSLKTPRMQGNDTWIGTGSAVYVTTESPLVEFSEEVRVDSVLKTREASNTDTWTGDGSTTQYNTTQQPLKPGSDWVYVNNTLQQRDVNYTINYDTGNITFTEAPANLLEVRATYKYGHYEIHYPSGTITFFSNSVPGASLDINALYTYKVYDIEYAVDPWVGLYATIKFAKPPGAGDTIDVEYLYGGVDNGDLISGPYFAGFTPGLHNVTEGKLKLTTANLLPIPIASTSGPGTLANVTFQVVGYGSSNITLGPETKLIAAVTYIPIPGIQLEHGYFSNKIGDVNGDGTVNKDDLDELNEAYGSEPGDDNWNPNCDLNNDGKVDALDLFDLSKNYGETI